MRGEAKFDVCNLKPDASVMKLPTVSLLTISQARRFPSLLILQDMIRLQTYVDIIEWIIVDGSQATPTLGPVIHLLDSPVPIRYIPTMPGTPLGTLRAIANEEATGDIRVVLDDDDYYPPTRVGHAVERLLTSGRQIAGCSPMIMYDFGFQRLYQFAPLGPNHSVSSCMAWTRDYAGVYLADVKHGEEAAFTRSFSAKMIQLDPVHTIVQSSHGTNTYSKKGLIESPTYLGKSLFELEGPVQRFIPADIFNRMVAALV